MVPSISALLYWQNWSEFLGRWPALLFNHAFDSFIFMCAAGFIVLLLYCIFRGKGGPNNDLHAVEIEFYGEINPSTSKYVVQSRNIPMVLMRKEAGAYWPHLMSTKEKVWLSRFWLTRSFFSLLCSYFGNFSQHCFTQNPGFCFLISKVFAYFVTANLICV